MRSALVRCGRGAGSGTPAARRGAAHRHGHLPAQPPHGGGAGRADAVFLVSARRRDGGTAPVPRAGGRRQAPAPAQIG
ncbi:hypothetical protein FDY95_19970 [Hymenobacter jeollabukensis]|uniref:Uncharacterized protein n=1 Tax=Hymenobacter jeollabukensis TaxID=2025313 RepID=A0A5R8WLP2_9BACT|nr:hypothetical protein FDY95_19970 [Hymenobacter jeollabukensis]